MIRMVQVKFGEKTESICPIGVRFGHETFYASTPSKGYAEREEFCIEEYLRSRHPAPSEAQSGYGFQMQLMYLEEDASSAQVLHAMRAYRMLPATALELETAAIKYEALCDPRYRVVAHGSIIDAADVWTLYVRTIVRERQSNEFGRVLVQEANWKSFWKDKIWKAEENCFAVVPKPDGALRLLVAN